jgi:hypothetical protein
MVLRKRFLILNQAAATDKPSILARRSEGDGALIGPFAPASSGWNMTTVTPFSGHLRMRRWSISRRATLDRQLRQIFLACL